MEWQALLSGALSVLAPGLAGEHDPPVNVEPPGSGVLTRVRAKYEALGPPPDRVAEQHLPRGFGGRADNLRKLAREYAAQGSHALAVHLFEQAHETAPADPDTLTELADALAAAGRPAEAETTFRRALAMTADRPVALRPLTGLAWLLRSRGRVEEADTLLRPGLTQERLSEVMKTLGPPGPPAAYRPDAEPVALPRTTTPEAEPETVTPEGHAGAGMSAAPPRKAAAAFLEPAGPNPQPDTSDMRLLEAERSVLERSVEDLRALEREYRTRMKAFLEAQLRHLDGLDTNPRSEQPPRIREPILVRTSTWFSDAPDDLESPGNDGGSGRRRFRAQGASATGSFTEPNRLPASSAEGMTPSGLPRRVKRASPIAGSGPPDEVPNPLLNADGEQEPLRRAPADMQGRLTSLRRGIEAIKRRETQSTSSAWPPPDASLSRSENSGEEER